MVPVAGVEPARCRHRGILSPVRLPIPSHRRVQYIIQHSMRFVKDLDKKIFPQKNFPVRNFVSIKCIDKTLCIVYNIKAFGTEVNMAE